MKHVHVHFYDSARYIDYGAGIAYVTEDDKVLLLMRADNQTWCFPGGHCDSGEDAVTTAKREAYEEVGYVPRGVPQPCHVCARAGWVFTTFWLRSPTAFTPTLSDEHTGYVWAPLDKLPTPLRDGVAEAITQLRKIV